MRKERRRGWLEELKCKRGLCISFTLSMYMFVCVIISVNRSGLERLLNDQNVNIKWYVCMHIVEWFVVLHRLLTENCQPLLQVEWLLWGSVGRQYVRGFWGLHRRGNRDVWAEESALWPLQYHQSGCGERIAAGLLHRRQYSDLLRSFVRLCHRKHCLF